MIIYVNKMVLVDSIKQMKKEKPVKLIIWLGDEREIGIDICLMM